MGRHAAGPRRGRAALGRCKQRPRPRRLQLPLPTLKGVACAASSPAPSTPPSRRRPPRPGYRPLSSTRGSAGCGVACRPSGPARVRHVQAGQGRTASWRRALARGTRDGLPQRQPGSALRLLCPTSCGRRGLGIGDGLARRRPYAAPLRLLCPTSCGRRGRAESRRSGRARARSRARARTRTPKRSTRAHTHARALKHSCTHTLTLMPPRPAYAFE